MSRNFNYAEGKIVNPIAYMKKSRQINPRYKKFINLKAIEIPEQFKIPKGFETFGLKL
ncbi:MAG: hypothetical protein KBT11_09235 [Treponema sp.]|nr:hypothetical protein [Candidatus Treponema equifaecale]